jgi:hypothetical protein
MVTQFFDDNLTRLHADQRRKALNSFRENLEPFRYVEIPGLRLTSLFLGRKSTISISFAPTTLRQTARSATTHMP